MPPRWFLLLWLRGEREQEVSPWVFFFFSFLIRAPLDVLSWEPSAGGAADLLTTETVKLVTAPRMLLIMIPPLSESSVKLCNCFLFLNHIPPSLAS